MALLTLKEAAARLNLNDQYLRKLCRDKKIEHTRVGSRYFMTPEQCDALVRVVPPAGAGDAGDVGGQK